MAIKGKGKTRSRRAVSPAPRPQIVTRKKPLLLRVTTWVVLGALVLGAIGFGVYEWWQHRQASELLAKEQTALQTVSQDIANQLPADKTTPQGTSQVILFPSLTKTMDQIDKGQLSDAKAKAAAKAVSEQATKASKGIEAIALRTIIKQEFTVGITPDLTAKGMTSSVLNEAQNMMIKGLQLYAGAGDLLAIAADTPEGPQRSAIVDQARQQAAIAGDLFNRGYNTVVQIETILGLIQPTGLAPSPAPGG
jgi:hypothetical protein